MNNAVMQTLQKMLVVALVATPAIEASADALVDSLAKSKVSGNVRLRQDASWTGAIAGGASVDVGWDAELVHAPFLGLAQ